MLSTKDIKVGGDGVSKVLEPGNNICKINAISLEEFKLKADSLSVILSLEGEDLGESFQGFFIDKNNESLGRHAGKVGNVKLTEWAFADGETKSGVVIVRDKEMLKALKQLCMNIDCMEWLDKQEGKHSTIQQFYTAFNKDAPYKGKFFNFCIAGKEYTNKSGYLAYDLFLPKYSKEGSAVSELNSAKKLTFNPEEHIKKKKVDTVEQFAPAPTFSLDEPKSNDIVMPTEENDFNL